MRTPEEIAKAREEYLKSHKPFEDMPTLAEWKEKSRVGSAFGPPYRASDPALKTIDALVEALQSVQSGGAEAYLLGELFFMTLWWLNNYKQDPARMQAGRRTAILGLNMYIATRLAWVLKCPLSGVARQLQDLYGVAMGKHGIETDRNNDPKYLQASKRERFRVLFKGGLAYVFASVALTEMEPFDTKGCYQPVKQAPNGKIEEPREGMGFVMSMSGDLYASDFKACLPYHSSFMGGRPVQCAGTISSTRGQIWRTKNDSGHYVPVDWSMAKMLQRLRSVGVNLRRITVEQAQRGGEANAVDFLAQNGNWDTILSSGTRGRRT